MIRGQGAPARFRYGDLKEAVRGCGGRGPYGVAPQAHHTLHLQVRHVRAIKSCVGFQRVVLEILAVARPVSEIDRHVGKFLPAASARVVHQEAEPVGRRCHHVAAVRRPARAPEIPRARHGRYLARLEIHPLDLQDLARPRVRVGRGMVERQMLAVRFPAPSIGERR